MGIALRQLVWTVCVSGIYLVAQLLCGTNAGVASLFSAAIFFGILSVFVGGGVRAAFGCLNAILIGKYLLIAIAIKSLLLEPSDGTLHAPLTTAWVMALGFFGLFLGTAIQ